MSRLSTDQQGNRFVSRITSFLSGGSFPAFALSALVFYQIFIALMAFVPSANGPWGDFLEEFRIRCFKYEPKSGWMQLSSVWVMLSEPLPLEALLFFIWAKPLRQ